MEKIIVVVGDRKNRHAHHLRFDGVVRIGRALSADVILGDEFVEPEQMILLLEEGRRSVQVLPGVNVVRRNGKRVLPGTYDFVSGDEWSDAR